MKLFDRITRWISGKTPEKEPAFSVSIETVGFDHAPPQPKPKRKLIQPAPICPCCDFRYEAFPKDKKPCPCCGKIVIIRSRDKIRHLLTKARAQEWDDDKKEMTLINKSRNYLSMGRVDPDRLQLVREQMIEETGHEISYGNVAIAFA